MPFQQRHSRTTATHQLTQADRSSLAYTLTTDGYRVILDVMEKCCHVQDSRLINVEVRDTSAILAEHTKTQAMWQMFEFFQNEIAREAQLHHEETMPIPDIPSPAEQELARILDPLRIVLTSQETP